MKTEKKSFRFNYDLILDLHGKTIEDAILEVEKAIYSGHYSNIMFIHGHGKGILKNAIRSFLQNCQYVKEIVPGEAINIPGTGGITIAYLNI